MHTLKIIKSSILRPSQEPGWEELFPKALRARTPRIWRMARVAADKLVSGCAVRPQSLISATALGALDETKSFFDGLFSDGFGSPKNFIASVHNSMAGKIALDLKIGGPNLTVCDSHNSFASAIVIASILSNSDFPALLLIIDEKTELLDEVIPNLSDTCKKHLTPHWEEAAVAFLLDRNPGNEQPCLSAVGPLIVNEPDSQETCTAMAASSGVPHLSIAPLHETSGSFIKPAIHAYDLANSSLRGNYAICSYSPSAGAAAAVILCM